MLGCKSSTPARTRLWHDLWLRLGSCLAGWLACRAARGLDVRSHVMNVVAATIDERVSAQQSIMLMARIEDETKGSKGAG